MLSHHVLPQQLLCAKLPLSTAAPHRSARPSYCLCTESRLPHHDLLLATLCRIESAVRSALLVSAEGCGVLAHTTRSRSIYWAPAGGRSVLLTVLPL